MGSTIPGPLNQLNQPMAIDAGTLCVNRTNAPSPAGLQPGSNLHMPRWDSGTIAEYRSFIAKEAMTRAQTSEKFDCADWIFAILIRFARENGLPLKFHKVGSGNIGSLWQQLGERDNIQAVRRGYDPAFPESSASAYGEYFAIETKVRNEMGARDLILLGFDNVLPVATIEMLQPGDIVALAAGDHRHVQLVLSNKTSIQVWDATKKANDTAVVLDILQGDLPANVIRRAAWDLTNGRYYRFDFTTKTWQIEADTPGDIRKLWHGTIFGRRWNFDRFNEAIQ